MDSASLQSLLKRLCNVMWAANVTNPITYVTQISYLLFLKMLEEMEAEQAAIVAPSGSVRDGKPPAKAGTTNGKRQPIFAKAKAGEETVDFARLRWSVLTSDPDNDRMLRTLRDLLPKLALHPALSPAAQARFEPYTPNPTCFLIFQKTGKPTKETWFYRVEGDGSSLKKARKFGPQFRNDFPDLLAKWPKRKTEEGRAWRVPAAKIIANGYNLTLASLGLVAPEMTEHAEPEDILTSVAEKEQRILALVEEMKGLLEAEA